MNKIFDSSVKVEYADKYNPYLARDYILADKIIDTRTDFSTTLTEDTTGTIYSKSDDDGTSYVYAGVVDNNWVHFAGYYWRIIRINGDGSIRMIYNGTSDNTTGSVTQLQTGDYNSSYNDNAYVGYMYGSTGASSYSETHANHNNSTIKRILDNWYKTNISGTEYEKSISTEAGFCNDRKVAGSNETYWTSDTKRGYGTNVTAYAPFSRFFTTRGSWDSTQTPTLNCSQIGTSTDPYVVVGAE